MTATTNQPFTVTFNDFDLSEGAHAVTFNRKMQNPSGSFATILASITVTISGSVHHDPWRMMGERGDLIIRAKDQTLMNYSVFLVEHKINEMLPGHYEQTFIFKP